MTEITTTVAPEGFEIVGTRTNVHKTSGRTYTWTVVSYRGEHAALGRSGNLYDNCSRCDGDGNYLFNQLDGTVCYGCFGSGVAGKATTPADFIRRADNRIKARAAAARKREREAAAAAAEAEVKWNTWATENAAVVEALTASKSTNPFISDLADKIANRQTLSPRQVEAVLAAITREAAKEAAKKEAPEGKATITGTITGTKISEFEDNWGRVNYTYKMFVQADGYRVFVTIPSSILDGPLENLHGRTVTFTATLTRSDDDASFAFGKRPSKASLAA